MAGFFPWLRWTNPSASPPGVGFAREAREHGLVGCEHDGIRGAEVRLEGKVAIISGGGSGIGAATAARFAEEGARVVILGRTSGRLEAVAERTHAVPVAGDAAVTADARRAVHTAVDRFGGLDVVVAAAGGQGSGAADRTDDDTWARSLESNVTSAFVLCREALPHLVERRGAIVIMASLAAHAAGPSNVGYVTGKTALIGLARSLARDYGPAGVRTNVVSPGWVRTPMADREMDALRRTRGGTREEAYLAATSRVPLRRPATPQEVASICLFLASDEASIVNGAIIPADGGASVVDVPTLAFEPDDPAARRSGGSGSSQIEGIE
jgi:meso-butanediol dehydrogenase/(S,S)-butanediol dehydrogenase/diacetyl reductase